MTDLYPLEDFTPEQKKTLDRFAREAGVRFDDPPAEPVRGVTEQGGDWAGQDVPF